MIDNLDRKIIAELQKNGRQAYLTLARGAGVTEGTIRHRVKGLLKKGLINITAVPHLDKLGYDFVVIVGLQVGLEDLQYVGCELAKHSNVCYISNVTGRYELIAIIAAKSAKEYSDFMERVVSSIHGVLRTETFVALKNYKGESFMFDTSGIISSMPISET